MKQSYQQIDALKNEIKQNLSFRFYLDHLNIQFNGKYAHSIYSKDETPSLLINKDDRTFHCFSTNTHGDIIKYHMDSNKLGFIRTLLELKDVLAVQRLKSENLYPLKKNKTKNIKDKLLMGEAKIYEKYFPQFRKKGFSVDEAYKKVMRIVLVRRQIVSTEVYNFIYEVCDENDYSEKAKKYLFGSDRKLTPKTIKIFRLLEIKNPHYLTACLRKKYPMHKLIRSGVFNKKRHFIFSKHSIIIPIIKNGKIVAIRGRAFPNTNYKPKYLNLAGHSAKMIYNVDALKKIKPKQALWLCEGEFETMIATQARLKAIGFPGVNGIPFEELKRLNISQYRLHVAFDADEAGDKAAQKLCDELGVKIKRIRPITGKDLSEVYNEN